MVASTAAKLNSPPCASPRVIEVGGEHGEVWKRPLVDRHVTCKIERVAQQCLPITEISTSLQLPCTPRRLLAASGLWNIYAAIKYSLPLESVEYTTRVSSQPSGHFTRLLNPVMSAFWRMIRGMLNSPSRVKTKRGKLAF